NYGSWTATLGSICASLSDRRHAGRGGKNRWLPTGFAVRRPCPETRMAGSSLCVTLPRPRDSIGRKREQMKSLWPDRVRKLAMAGSLKKFAEAFALGMSATDAAIAAGYPRGKSAKTFAANARRRAGSKRVRKIVDELPAKEKIQQQIAANMEWATQQLFEVGN